MATIGRTNGASFTNTPRLQYISTAPFNTYFYTYSTSLNSKLETIGTLSVVSGATAFTCPKGHVLRENGRKLYPDANPGVTTYMVGVYDAQSMLSGFIDPNAKVFQIYNTDKPNFLADGVTGGTTDLGPSVYTAGDLLAGGNLDISGSAHIYGNTIVQSTLTVYGSTIMNAGATVTGGEVITTGDLTVTLGKVYARGGVGTQLGTTVSQSGSRTNTVTVNTTSGRINLVQEVIGANGYNQFVLNNTYIDVGDYVAVQVVGVAGTIGAPSCHLYTVSAAVTADNTAKITLHNALDINTGNETVTLQFMIFKGAY